MHAHDLFYLDYGEGWDGMAWVTLYAGIALLNTRGHRSPASISVGVQLIHLIHSLPPPPLAVSVLTSFPP